MQTLWIKSPRAIWTGNDLDASAGVVVANGKIIELVARDTQPESAIDEIFDASEQCVLPGLINCHHHFYQTLTRAFPAALNKELFEWLTSLYPVWSGLTEEAVAISTQLATAELLLSGCTTVSDHHYLFNEEISRAIDIQADVVQQMGIRAVLTRGSMSLGKSAGGLPPDSVVQASETILLESERLVHKYHQRNEGALLQIALAPCSPFSVTKELMKDTAELAANNDVLLHTHLAETEDENAFCLKLYGLRPLDYLEEVNWLRRGTWLAHGIHFQDEEIQRLGEASVGISHCPSSNMLLGSGIARVKELELAGCPVGIGVDGSASNDISNLMVELRQALLIQRLRYGSASISHEDVFRWATLGGAALFNRDDIGQLAVGKQADIAMFDLSEMRFSGGHDPLASLVLCGAQKASHVMVAGQWRVSNGELLAMDMAALRAEHEQAAKQLVSNF